MLLVMAPRDQARTRIAPVMLMSLKPSTMVVMVSSKDMILEVSAMMMPMSAMAKAPQYRASCASQASRMAIRSAPVRSGLVMPV